MDNPYLIWNWFPVLDFPIDFGPYGGVQYMHIDLSFISDVFSIAAPFFAFVFTVLAFFFIMRIARTPDNPRRGKGN